MDSGQKSELQPEISSVDENKKTLSRRQFLRWLGAAAVTIPAAVSAVEKGAVNALVSGLASPKATDNAITVIKEAADKLSENNENVNFRPITEIVDEGITTYERNSGKKALYRRSVDYKGPDYYRGVLGQISTSIVLPNTPDDLLKKLKDKLPGEAMSAYVTSDLRMSSWSDVYATGSGYYERFKKRHQEIYGKDGQITNYDQYFKFTEAEGQTEIEEAVKFVEEKKAEQGRPISSSSLLSYFLEKNEGNLSRSVYDTAIFLKFMARNDIKTGSINYDQNNINWFQQSLRDEYQGPTYSQPADEKTLINLIGKPYHTWNLIALLCFFPVEIIQYAGVYRQMATLGGQGLDKTKADLQTLQDLRSLDQKFQTRQQ